MSPLPNQHFGIFWISMLVFGGCIVYYVYYVSYVYPFKINWKMNFPLGWPICGGCLLVSRRYMII